jgi:regulator of replication initiation timing
MEQQLKRIQDKLQQLLKQQTLLLKENERLTLENKELKERLGKHQDEAETLEQRIAALKMATGSLNDKEKKELEKRMNGYIKEIDRCISMLAE